METRQKWYKIILNNFSVLF